MSFRQAESPQAESQLAPALPPADLEVLVLVRALAQEAQVRRRPEVAGAVLWGEASVATLAGRLVGVLVHLEIQA